MKKSLAYYENYRTVRRMKSVKEKQLSIAESDRADPDIIEKLKNDIEQCNLIMRCIEDDIHSYVPDDASGRLYRQLSDERIFLELRCLSGMTIESAAEAMYISRDTAYRIRRRIASPSRTLSDSN